MPMDEQEKITPYRMNLMVQTAAKITEMIVNGKYLYKPSGWWKRHFMNHRR